MKRGGNGEHDKFFGIKPAVKIFPHFLLQVQKLYGILWLSL